MLSVLTPTLAVVFLCDKSRLLWHRIDQYLYSKPSPIDTIRLFSVYQWWPSCGFQFLVSSALSTSAVHVGTDVREQAWREQGLFPQESGGWWKDEVVGQFSLLGSEFFRFLHCWLSDTLGIWPVKTCATYPQTFFSRNGGGWGPRGNQLTQVHLENGRC